MRPVRFIFTIVLPLMAFIAITYSVIEGKTTQLDSMVYQKVSEHISSGSTEFMKVVSFFGSGQLLIILSFALILIYRYERKSFFSLIILVNLISSSIINTTIKYLIRRDRPDILRLIQIIGYSFPSGHSMVSMSFYGFLTYLCLKKYKTWWGRVIAAFLIMLILMIGLSRIYLGVHYFSDVIAGFSLGIFWIGIFSIITETIYNKKIIKS